MGKVDSKVCGVRGIHRYSTDEVAISQVLPLAPAHPLAPARVPQPESRSEANLWVR
jgi:hypothetical protein